ncbi:hypothetical protein [Sphingobium sp. DN12]|uniref:hypothetical protein n=1 Tax=Sphingobium sp. DN12 TaxID=3378073 RepID=UPI003DA2E4DA
MLGRDVVASGLIPLKFLAMPDIPRDEYDDEQGNDHAAKDCTGLREPARRGLLIRYHQ